MCFLFQQICCIESRNCHYKKLFCSKKQKKKMHNNRITREEKLLSTFASIYYIHIHCCSEFDDNIDMEFQRWSHFHVLKIWWSELIYCDITAKIFTWNAFFNLILCFSYVWSQAQRMQNCKTTKNCLRNFLISEYFII